MIKWFRGTDHLKPLTPAVRLIAAVVGILSLLGGIYLLVSSHWVEALLFALPFAGLMLGRALIGKDMVDDPPSPSAKSRK